MEVPTHNGNGGYIECSSDVNLGRVPPKVPVSDEVPVPRCVHQQATLFYIGLIKCRSKMYDYEQTPNPKRSKPTMATGPGGHMPAPFSRRGELPLSLLTSTRLLSLSPPTPVGIQFNRLPQPQPVDWHGLSHQAMISSSPHPHRIVNPFGFGTGTCYSYTCTGLPGPQQQSPLQDQVIVPTPSPCTSTSRFPGNHLVSPLWERRNHAFDSPKLSPLTLEKHFPATEKKSPRSVSSPSMSKYQKRLLKMNKEELDKFRANERQRGRKKYMKSKMKSFFQYMNQGAGVNDSVDTLKLGIHFGRVSSFICILSPSSHFTNIRGLTFLLLVAGFRRSCNR